MSSKKLRRLGLNSEIVENLTRKNVTTCKDLLSKTDVELLILLGHGYHKTREVIEQCSRGCVPTCITALEMLQKRKSNAGGFFPTSLPDLDKVLLGGLPVDTITEIAGPSGCGKTQFCIMLSALCAMPKSYGGLNGAVIYIDTESAFTAGRLMEVASAKFPEYFKEESKLEKLAGQVYVDVVSTCSSMIQRLQCLEDDIIAQGVKLVIVDSIASLVRKEYSSHVGRNLAERTNFLTKQAAILKYLAETFSIPVVVTNQITTHFQKSQGAVEQKAAYQSLDNDGAYVTAALGNTWSHSVNTRLIVQYLGDKRRQILVAKSPVAPFTAFTYTIQASGIQMEEGGSDHYAGTDPGIQQILVRSSIPNPALML